MIEKSEDGHLLLIELASLKVGDDVRLDGTDSWFRVVEAGPHSVRCVNTNPSWFQMGEPESLSFGVDFASSGKAS